MPITLDDIAFLSSERGQEILADYATADVSDKHTLQMITQLRQTLSLEHASAVLITLQLRQKAMDKFPSYSDQLLFTEDSLQQASDYHIRQYRARLIESRHVLDVCCSIGADTLAFAENGHDVLGLDIDPVRIAIAKHNADVMGIDADFEVMDVTQTLPAQQDFVFFDPARRSEAGDRIFDVEGYIPPLSLIERFKANDIAVKLSPAVDLAQLQSYGGQVEFISVEGALKEAILWKHREGQPMATLIKDGVHHFYPSADLSVEIENPRQWLFEPDASILRAGLVQDLASGLDATMLDETIAYLTMDERVETPWGRYWRILDWMPFNLKKLRHYLVEHQVRHVTVKKRGFPMSPEEVIAKLKLKKGHQSRVLVMTRLRDDPIVLICE